MYMPRYLPRYLNKLDMHFPSAVGLGAAGISVSVFGIPKSGSTSVSRGVRA